jgi:uncharacterized sulfatase
VGAAARGDAAAAQPPGERLNLISIVTDDQAAWTVGAYGNREVDTPHMDRLAREGARFTNAFAASGVCTPSRVAFLTGLYPIQAGMTDAPYRRDPDEGLPLGVPTWPRVLQRHGYLTGLIGKWHLGRTREHYPTRYGFDYFYGFLAGGTYPMNPVLVRDGAPRVVRGPTPDVLTDDAIEFVRRNRGKPFALLLHFRETHAPHLPVPEADLAPYAGLDPTVPVVDPRAATLDDDQEPADSAAIALHVKLLKQKVKAYYSSVHAVDRNLGRLLAVLDSLDLTRRTIVLFTSDQGYLFGHRGLKGKGAAQPIRNHTLSNDAFVVNMFDVALRIPLVVRWPGVARPGTVIDRLVSNVDTFAGVLGMLGIPRPAEAPATSRDFSRLLRGDAAAWSDTVFAEYTPDQIGALRFIRMIRTPKWKLVRTYLDPAADELYDLEHDPDETRNLYYANRRPISREADSGQARVMVPHPFQEQLSALRQRLDRWEREIGDPAPELDARYRRAKLSIRERWRR